MPIIATILLTAALWTLYWFVNMGGLEHIRERAERRKEEARKAEARERGRTASLRAVEDPRDAAMVLMLLIPRGSDPSPRQITAIEETAGRAFGFAGDLVARVTQARFIAASAQGFDDAVTVFTDLLTKRLTADERQELIDMVREIAQLDGPSSGQVAAIERLEQRIGLVPAQ